MRISCSKSLIRKEKMNVCISGVQEKSEPSFLDSRIEDHQMHTTTLKVLVVDDDEDIRDVLRELLAEEGFYVRTAQDGREALEILKEESGWIVLLDMRMPVLDGVAVLRELERNRRLQAANKIAIMSAGWDQPQDSSRLQNELVKAFLPKPFELETVVDVVHQLAS